MKRGKYMKKKNVALTLALVMGLLTGCAGQDGLDEQTKQDIQHSLEETENVGNESVQTLAEQFQLEETSPWSDKFYAADASGEEVDIRINAPISVPDANKMYVAECTLPTFDAAYKKNVIQAVFGQNRVYYYDEKHRSKEDLRKMIEEEEGELQTALSIEGMDESEIADMQESIRQWQQFYEQASDDYTVVTDYDDANQFMVQVNDCRYLISFSDYYEMGLTIDIKPMDMDNVCKEDFSDYSMIYWTGVGDIEAVQEFTVEQATDFAEEFLQKLGVTNDWLSESAVLGWRGAKQTDGETELSDIYCEGYFLVYTFGLDGVDFADYGDEQEYAALINWDKYDDYTFTSQLTLEVSEQGVIGMTWINPYQFDAVYEASMLPLDTVERLIKEELQEHGERYDLTHYYFNALDLMYVRVADEDEPGRYSYLPVWRLSNKTTGGEWTQYKSVLLVNAIDGSILYLEDILPMKGIG